MLYLVATPIGNLEDITLRALKILKNADIIACEDTRNTQKLLNHYEITGKKLISYHEHNEDKMSDKIIEYLQDNLEVALVTDAGLVSSGIESYNYTFYGFLPRKSKDLKQKLEFILKEKTTSIIYESPHRIKNLVTEITKIEPTREISVAREITKMFEQIETQSAENILARLGEDIKEKGEFVVIVSPNKVEEGKEINLEDIVEIIYNKVQNGEKKSEAIKNTAKEFGINKKEVYSLYHEKYD